MSENTVQFVENLQKKCREKIVNIWDGVRHHTGEICRIF
jgi:hypothetical protein